MLSRSTLSAVLGITLGLSIGSARGSDPVIQVFILAGQSNMEGQGVVSMDDPKHYNGGKGNLVWSMKHSRSAPGMKHLAGQDGEWLVRDDVRISFKSREKIRSGRLSVGYTGYGGDSHIGPELQFGHVIGDYLEEPVLLIKTAWGGKSLFVDFRPPSSEGQTGPYYIKMVEEVRAALAALEGKRYRLAGFVWMQGWNDMCTPPAIPEYSQNLRNLVKDIREEFNAPGLPVVVGELGNGGPVKGGGAMSDFRKAQAEGTRQIENAVFVKTTGFARPRELSPNIGHGHHWFGNAESYFLVGDALGKAMVGLLNGDEIRVPAYTAYLDPDTGGARISKEKGIVSWRDPDTEVLWFGEFREAGRVEVSLDLDLAGNEKSKLQLTFLGQSRVVEVSPGTETVSFGEFDIKKPGYQRFVLASLNPQGREAGTIGRLVIHGPPAASAHFNRKPRRNAASVHLSYPVPKGTEVDAFYVEMTGLEDPLWTYYMSCGWHRGYFGMQVNSPTERRIIFSVWDSGNEAIDRKKVSRENRVTLVAKGKDVYSGDFGNEGTGGHSHLKFQWKTGQKQKFLVTAEPVDDTHTVFSGYYFRPDLEEWFLISSWNAPKEGGYMRGLYSFSENFVGRNGHLLRKALYGNQWIRTSDGEWIEITRAKFSHDATGKADRQDRFMGIEGGQFFLSQGGFVAGRTEFGEPFDRSPGKRPALPEEIMPSSR